MSSEKDAIAEGLLKAIKAESDGQHFYLMAARSTQDPKGREIFETLADEEAGHMRFLKHQYKSILEKGEVDLEQQLGSRLMLEGMHPIFSGELQARIKDAHFEMTALSIGIKLELDAMEFYKAEAVAHSDPAVTKFYEDLAEWESCHYNALLQQHEALKEDYFSGSNFSPF
ncbi:ferritin family protein [Acidobacteriota bacterium]